jgi:exodeoxyribonuclease V alpha subunit
MRDLNASGLFSAFDLHFARFIRRFGGADPELVFLSAALLSRATAEGDVCLDLNAWAHRPVAGSQDQPACPAAERWSEALRGCPAVGRPGERRPLVLDQANRLYLHRYWEYENRLAAGLLNRAESPPENLDAGALKTAIQRQFKRGDPAEIDWQQVAVAVSLLKRLAVIAGGPGTGKTTTITKILAVWEDLSAGRTTRVLLAAPTGKAAARLKESLQALSGRPSQKTDGGPTPAYEAYTLHRLLRPVAGTPLFRHNADRPLPVDLMIVDEVSMVDLALMAKLMDALPESARLVLIGDRDQLASVEAGSVLGEICGRGRGPKFGPEFGALIRRVTGQAVPLSTESRPLQDCIVELQTSRRFGAASDIGKLSRAVNRGDASGTLAILEGTGDGSVSWQEPWLGPKYMVQLERCLAPGYAAYPSQGDPARVLQQLGRFKVLCAHRLGPSGVAAINQLTERILTREGCIRPRARSPWYAGRPVLITQNDYRLGLFNGDLGIALSDSAEPAADLAVFFMDASGGLRRFPPYRLPPHETVYAMTVHKSQGSEFEEVLLILPAEDSPILSRELIYTALTRARKRFTLLGRRDVLAAAIHRRIERTSGLRDALWSDACAACHPQTTT